LVRACECDYDTKPIEKLGIQILVKKNFFNLQDIPFDDGEKPPKEVISKWLKLVSEFFTKNSDSTQDATIAVHCVAGLGRAPLLVAIAILEKDKKISPIDVITLIRKQRRGALNKTQINFLQNYRSGSSCIFM
jgi:protein tyrosine phosphatase type IVA